MTYATSNKTVTDSYADGAMTTNTTGEAIFQNRSKVPVRVAMGSSAPADTVLGTVLEPGMSISRGSGTGHIYARVDRDGGNDVTCTILEDNP